MSLKQGLHAAHKRVGTGIREQRFYRLKISRCAEDAGFLPEGSCIRRLQRKDAVKCGKSFGETAQALIRNREIDGGIDVARIELDGAAEAYDRLIPMRKPPLDK